MEFGYKGVEFGMERFAITPDGYTALTADLRRHRETLRPQIVRDIEEARAHGDLSENSEYDDARERQALCEARIRLLESQIASAEIIDIAKLPRNGRVVFGTTVTIENADTGLEKTWQIVGESEADIESGRISYRSPLARALIGRNEGDEAVVPAPGGKQTWEIIEVAYE